MRRWAIGNRKSNPISSPLALGVEQVSATIEDSPEGAVVTAHVQPRAARTEYVGVYGNTLKFRVAAPPVEGAANEELCRYLAGLFGLSKGEVLVRSGQAARRKRILLKHVLAKRVREILNIGPRHRR